MLELDAERDARLLIDGRWCEGSKTYVVTDKFTGAHFGRGHIASESQVGDAVAAAKRSFDGVKLEPYQRYRILMKAAELIEIGRAHV